MKVVIERTPFTASTGNVAGAQDRVSIQIEGDPNDLPEDVAHAFVKVEKIIKGEHN